MVFQPHGVYNRIKLGSLARMFLYSQNIPDCRSNNILCTKFIINADLRTQHKHSALFSTVYLRTSPEVRWHCKLWFYGTSL